MIEIYVRDCNGKREIWAFHSHDEFILFYNDADSSDINEGNYEILMVVYDGHCVYSELAHDPIDFEDLLGFFA